MSSYASTSSARTEEKLFLTVRAELVEAYKRFIVN